MLTPHAKNDIINAINFLIFFKKHKDFLSCARIIYEFKNERIDLMDKGESSYRSYLEGDESAFEEIVKEFREPLTNFIYGIIEDHQEAEDIAIDVFAYLAAKRGYNFKVSLKTYLFMLGKSRAFDFLRRRKIRSAVELSEVEDYIPSEFSLEEDLLEKERQIMVHRAVSSLSPKMRTAVILIYFENMSYEDAAKVMKLSKKQVDNLLYRAKVRLKTIIGKENV